MAMDGRAVWKQPPGDPRREPRAWRGQQGELVQAARTPGPRVTLAPWLLQVQSQRVWAGPESLFLMGSQVMPLLWPLVRERQGRPASPSEALG